MKSFSEEYMDESFIQMIKLFKKYFSFDEGFFGRGYSGGTLNLKFPSSNDVFKNSHIYLDSVNKEFIHFTSLKTFFSILDTQELRLYSLNKCKDKSELSGVAYQCISDEEKKNFIEKQIKPNCFIFSSCLYDKEFNYNYHWTNYSSDHSGVGIVFEIINESSLWDNYLFLKIDYKFPDHVREFFKEIEKLEKLRNIKTDIDFFPLMCFFKDEHKYKDDNEVRLLYYLPGKWDDQFNIRRCSYDVVESDRGVFELVKFLKLPFYKDITHPNYKDYDKPYLEINDEPMIKIKKIIIGKNLKAEQNVEDFLKRQKIKFSVYFGYSIEVEFK